MTLVGVISDSHGDTQSLIKAVAKIGKVDLWLHAGDFCGDSETLAALTAAPVLAVAGNCDRLASEEANLIFTVAGYKLWLTHGHQYLSHAGSLALTVPATQYDAQIIVYGHTHIPEIAWREQRLFFNPGSTSRPRGGFRASCGLLRLAAGQLPAGKIIEL